MSVCLALHYYRGVIQDVIVTLTIQLDTVYFFFQSSDIGIIPVSL